MKILHTTTTSLFLLLVAVSSSQTNAQVTDAPVVTPAPITPTDAPIDPTPAPVVPTPAPVKITDSPTANPTGDPTKRPTDNPTNIASARPTDNPTRQPSARPTGAPSTPPTKSPAPTITPQPTTIPEDDLWIRQIRPEDGSEAGITYSNGVFLSPNNQDLMVTSEGGTVTCLDAFTGETKWWYKPSTGKTISTHSGIVFTENDAGPYMVYSITENENSATPMGRVVAMDMEGNELWISDEVEGIPRGSPVVSSDGNYVFLTHNDLFGLFGAFSIMRASDNGSLFFTQTNLANSFGPPGIYHSPLGGYYEGGESNTNDFVMFSAAPQQFATSIGEGALYGFQFPRGFQDGDDTTGVGYIQLGDARNFQGITPPVLTNNGHTAYVSTSRSSWYSWLGQRRAFFNKGHSKKLGFTRNKSFAGQPCFAAVALSESTTEPYVFGGSAHTEFVKTSYDFAEEQIVELDSHVYAKAIVGPDDVLVYYVELDGDVHQANFKDLSDNWVYKLRVPVEGEMALHPKGWILYIGDIYGKVTALQVADIPQTLKPTPSPTPVPTSAPVPPTNPPTSNPTPLASEPPTPGPTPVSRASKPIYVVSIVAAAAVSLLLSFL